MKTKEDVMNEIKRKAEIEAIFEIKDEIKEQMKADIRKTLGSKKSFMEKASTVLKKVGDALQKEGEFIMSRTPSNEKLTQSVSNTKSSFPDSERIKKLI